MYIFLFAIPKQSNMKPTYFIINTPRGQTIWSKELVILPNVRSHLLPANVADRIIAAVNVIPDLDKVHFKDEFINEAIERCCLRQQPSDFKLLSVVLLDFWRPAEKLIGGDDANLLF